MAATKRAAALLQNGLPMSVESGVGLPPVAATVLRSAPGGEAIRRFLNHQVDVPRRSWVARLFGVSPLTHYSARWYWSAVGALELVAELESLAPEFRIVHGIPGVPVARGEAEGENNAGAMVRGIEHVVVGPPGVFVVSAYNHYRENVWVSGKNFVVEGHQLPYVRHAESGIGYVERMLSATSPAPITATALIVVIAPAAISLGELPRDVFVVPSGVVTSWFAGLKSVLDPAQVRAIAAAAGSAETWVAAVTNADEMNTHGGNTAGGNTAVRGAAEGRTAACEQVELAQFEAVRREMSAARCVRAAWAAALVLGTIGALMTVSILKLAG